MRRAKRTAPIFDIAKVMSAASNNNLIKYALN
jgi:hypothetical protein